MLGTSLKLGFAVFEACLDPKSSPGGAHLSRSAIASDLEGKASSASRRHGACHCAAA